MKPVGAWTNVHPILEQNHRSTDMKPVGAILRWSAPLLVPEPQESSPGPDNESVAAILGYSRRTPPYWFLGPSGPQPVWTVKWNTRLRSPRWYIRG